MASQEQSYDVYDVDAEDLATAVIGHAVTAVDVEKWTMALDDGTTLVFDDASGCCAWSTKAALLQSTEP